MSSVVPFQHCMKTLRRVGGLLPLLFATAVGAQVTVSDAWIRGTVPGQPSTGAYMRLSSAKDASLVSVSTPVAKVTEIHEMKLEAGVMHMHAVPNVPLPAGRPVEFGPGGYHVMLMELTRPLKDGESVPLTLTVQDATGAKSTVQVKATVRPLAEGAPPSSHMHGR